MNAEKWGHAPPGRLFAHLAENLPHQLVALITCTLAEPAVERGPGIAELARAIDGVCRWALGEAAAPPPAEAAWPLEARAETGEAGMLALRAAGAIIALGSHPRHARDAGEALVDLLFRDVMQRPEDRAIASELLADRVRELVPYVEDQMKWRRLDEHRWCTESLVCHVGDGRLRSVQRAAP